MNQQNYMKLAIDHARSGITQSHGGPFGACIICNDEVIATTHNTVLKDHDPTCHAEMNAIRIAAKELGTHDLSNCVIYTTSEPCPMCRAAIYWAGINKIVYGVDKSVAATYGFNDEEFTQQMQLPASQRSIPEENGYCAEAIKKLFAEWKNLGLPLY